MRLAFEDNTPTVRFFYFVLKSEWNQYGRLPAHLFKVMAGILSYGDKEAWPSVDRLAKESGVSRFTVMRAIEELERLGAIKVDRVTGKLNHYRIVIDFQLPTGSIGATCDASATSSADALSPVAPLNGTSSTGATEPVARVQPKGLREGFKKEDLREGKTAAIAAVADFEKFWLEYPRKVAKPNAVKAWKKIKPSEVDALMAALARQKRSEQWTKDGGQFIPHPATWLNQRRWEDGEVVVAAPELKYDTDFGADKWGPAPNV